MVIAWGDWKILSAITGKSEDPNKLTIGHAPADESDRQHRQQTMAKKMDIEKKV